MKTPRNSTRCRAKNPAQCPHHGMLTPEILNRELDKIDNRPVLGWDVDNTLLEYERALAEEHSLITGNPLELYVEASNYSFVKSGWPFKDEDDFRRAHAEAVDRGLYGKLKAIPGAAEVVRRLAADGYKIHIITSRFIRPGQHAEVLRQTAESLDKAGIPYNEISFTSNKVGVVADVYIDDAPYNIDALTAAGRPVVVPARKYNEGYENRFTSYEELEAAIRKIAPIEKPKTSE